MVIVFQSGDIAARGVHTAKVSVAALDNGSFHLNVHGSGVTSTTFMDATGISSLIEALTNALNRVEQVQP